MQLPCSVQGKDYICTGKGKCGEGGYGVVVPGKCINDGFIYALKFISMQATARMFPMNEAEITRIMSNLKSPYSITLHDLDEQFAPDSSNLTQVLVLDYYPLGDAHNIDPRLFVTDRRDEYVLKFLTDISPVLQTLYSQSIIDRDVKLRNILIYGDLGDPQTTTFVKTDYGITISKTNAEKLLVDYGTRSTGEFSHWGTNISPIDLRIIYGLGLGSPGRNTPMQQATRQKVQLDAAIVLLNNLESNDLIDLVQAAVCFYDKLTPNVHEKIGLCKWSFDHTQIDRTHVVAKKITVLNKRYNDEMYKNPEIIPTTIKDLLIKMEWLSTFQLPEIEIRGTETYLNWDTFYKWMKVADYYTLSLPKKATEHSNFKFADG